MDIKHVLGQNVKKYRKARGYTQMQFAEIIDVDQKHVSFIESGNSFPSASLLAKISEKLNILPNKLFDLQDSMSEEQIKKNIFKIIDKLDYESMLKVHNYISFLYVEKL